MEGGWGEEVEVERVEDEEEEEEKEEEGGREGVMG